MSKYKIGRERGHIEVRDEQNRVTHLLPTFTCSHCNGIFVISPEKETGFCYGCFEPVCLPCAKAMTTGEEKHLGSLVVSSAGGHEKCATFERKMDLMEKRAQPSEQLACDGTRVMGDVSVAAPAHARLLLVENHRHDAHVLGRAMLVAGVVVLSHVSQRLTACPMSV